jgi:polyisoprenoid-binding protein YceI
MLQLLIVSFALTGCVEDVSKDKVEATVADAKKVEAVAAEEKAKATTLAVDPSSSTIKALGAKVTATHPIDFKQFEGKLMVDGGKLKGVDFTVDMASLESDDPRLTKHLMNEDFFDVPNHPTATFVSTKITPGEGDKVEIEGNMTIRGTSKSITFPATVSHAGDMLKAQAEFALDRQDFKVTYPGKPDDLIQDKVVMNIELVAKK